MNRTYEFTVNLIGKGDTLEEAFRNARENADLSELQSHDCNPELAEIECPECSESFLLEWKVTEAGKHLWSCDCCKKVWLVTDEETSLVGELNDEPPSDWEMYGPRGEFPNGEFGNEETRRSRTVSYDPPDDGRWGKRG